MSNVRDISASLRICFNVVGHVVRHAYTFADFDGDGLNEFVVGTVDGNLFIFKDKHASPRWKSSNLGTITALTFGNVRKNNSNDLIVLTAEGWLYTFSPDKAMRDRIEIQHDTKQLLNPNARMSIIYDTNDDGCNELIVSYADRRVRVFKYVTNHDNKSVDKRNISGKFVAAANWTLDGQVGTITINLGEHGKKELLASQPGATFISLNLAATTEPSTDFADIFYNPVGSVPARTSINAFTEIVGMLNPCRGSLGANMGVCTSDGLVMLMNHVDKIIWTEHMESRMIALDKVNLSSQSDKPCDILACCENGVLYIISENKDICRFDFGARPSNFCSGEYGIDGKNSPVLTFFTFRNHIVMYYNVDISCRQQPCDLITLLRAQANKDILDALAKKVDGECTRKNLAFVIHKLLYGNTSSRCLANPSDSKASE